MVIIGIGGQAGAGKSTLARLLLDLYGSNRGHILPFAEGVKDVAKSMGWNGLKDEKGRRLLQLIGTECGRECIDPDIWVNRWRTKVSANTWGPEEKLIVADDLRFQNEKQRIHIYNGLTVLVKGRSAGVPTNHASEAGLPESCYDVIIDNSGTMEELAFAAQSILKRATIRTH